MPTTVSTQIKKITTDSVTEARDLLAAEEPLEIRVEYGPKKSRITKSVSVTMRTPGNDFELAAGFLFTEGIIKLFGEIVSIKSVGKGNENIVCVSLHEKVDLNIAKLERNFYTTSSCGVCGKASIEAVRTACNIPESFDKLRISAGLLYGLPGLLRTQQAVFENTGGLHACGLFDMDGNLKIMREDVGRHNALDKLVGAALEMGLLPLENYILLLSGRASFELVQKAVMAGIKIVAAVGAPSSLAAEVAEEWGMTLIGFLRGERFNIYSGAERVLI